MTSSDVDVIKDIFQRQLPEKVRTRDVCGYASLFTEDAAWFPQNGVERRGPGEIAIGLGAVLAGITIDPTFQVDRAEVFGDFGYVLGTSKEVMQPLGGGDTTIAYSRELWHFRKASGSWKISVLLYNLAPAPAAG